MFSIWLFHMHAKYQQCSCNNKAKNTRVDGPLNAKNTRVDGPLKAKNTRVDGPLKAKNTRIDGPLKIQVFNENI